MAELTSQHSAGGARKRRLTQRRAAAILGVGHEHLNRVIRGHRHNPRLLEEYQHLVAQSEQCGAAGSQVNKPATPLTDPNQK